MKKGRAKGSGFRARVARMDGADALAIKGAGFGGQGSDKPTLTSDEDRVLGELEKSLRDDARKNDTRAVAFADSENPELKRGVEMWGRQAKEQTARADAIKKARELLKGGEA